MSLIENERTKLTATYINGIAIAVFAVGSFAPTITSLNGAVGFPVVTGIAAVSCICASGALHFMARRVLKGLRHDD
jgi:multidrug transporter EmrE-like cation transporter